MSIEAVRANYNQIGIEIIEKMYSNNYLSIGGIESTDILATKAGIAKDSLVLDVGSGLGGPALYLAEHYGCQITGLDVTELNVQEARKRAQAKELDHLVQFEFGTATEMPFESGTFTVVWGQDAWCHVTDKKKLVQECARVLVPGGTIAFTDWLQTGEMDDADREEVLSAVASPDFETLEGYYTLLETHGLSVVEQEDISATFVAQYRSIITKLETLEAQITDKFGPKVYGIVLQKNSAILKAFTEKKMGGGRFIGKKRD